MKLKPGLRAFHTIYMGNGTDHWGQLYRGSHDSTQCNHEWRH